MAEEGKIQKWSASAKLIILYQKVGLLDQKQNLRKHKHFGIYGLIGIELGIDYSHLKIGTVSLCPSCLLERDNSN